MPIQIPDLNTLKEGDQFDLGTQKYMKTPEGGFKPVSATPDVPPAPIPNPALAAIGTGSGIASSGPAESATADAERKKREAADKAAADDQDTIANLTRQKQIAELKASLAPSIPAPDKPNLEGAYTGLLSEKDATGNSLQDYQTQLADNRKQAADIQASLDEFTSTAAEGQSESAFLSQKSEKQRLAQSSLDRLDREANIINTQVTNRTNTISTLMGLKKEDYANTVAAYDKDFANNLKLYDSVLTQETSATKNALANLETTRKAITDGNLTYNSLPTDAKAHIAELELQAYGPSGVGLTALLKPAEKVQDIYTNSDGNRVAVFYDSANKAFRSYVLGKATGTGEAAVVTDFRKDLIDRGALDKAGTREQFIRQLVAKYPQIDESSISEYVYGTYPDGYNKTQGGQGIDYYVKQVKSGAITIDNVPASVRNDVADQL